MPQISFNNQAQPHTTFNHIYAPQSNPQTTYEAPIANREKQAFSFRNNNTPVQGTTVYNNHYSARHQYQTPIDNTQYETKLIATSNVQPVNTYTHNEPHSNFFNKSVEKTEVYSTKNQVLQELRRPDYNKIYSRPVRQSRAQAPLNEEPAKKNTVCGTPCWILLGLLGLLGVILGMLFGLGVIGGFDGLNLSLNGAGIDTDGGDSQNGTDNQNNNENGEGDNNNQQGGNSNNNGSNSNNNGGNSNNEGNNGGNENSNNDDNNSGENGGSGQIFPNTDYRYPPTITTEIKSEIVPSTSVQPTSVLPTAVQPVPTKPASVAPISTMPVPIASNPNIRPLAVNPVSTAPLPVSGVAPALPDQISPLVHEPMATSLISVRTTTNI